jgi:DNA-binding MarR family transcriptional regulator
MMDGNLAYVTLKSKSKYAASPDKPSYGGSDVDYSILSEAVLYRLRRAQLAVVQDFNDSLASIGLRPADFSVLIVVANNTDLKQSDVAEALGIQRANFVAIIDNLEAKGLLARRKSDTDRRVHFLDMTPDGREMLSNLSEIWKHNEEKLISRLGGEKARNQLINLLRRIKD